MPVFVYTSGDEAELFVNERSLGLRKKAPDVDTPLDHSFADPRDHESFKDVASRHLYFGKMMVVVRRVGAGPILLRGCLMNEQGRPAGEIAL